MTPYDLDYSTLEQIDNKTYKYSEIKHLLKKVAFNIVKFVNDPKEELWEVMSAEDGDYIVAKYNEKEENIPKTATQKSPWEAIVKSGSLEVNLFYKGMAITKFAHKDAEMVSSFLPQKLATDAHFVEALFASLTKERQTEIKKLYPELF